MRYGEYESIEVIGRGGTATVLRGRGPDGREVAIKVLKSATNELARVRREWRLLRELGEAEGFVPLLDAGLSPQGPYFVMPLVAGGTLRDRLKRGPLPVEDAVHLCRQIAAALGRAHARGIVHRDVKPENVLFTKDGRPLLADLGLAKHFRDDAPGAAQSVKLSETGTFAGTAHYMSPEQMTDAKSVGPPADTWSMGAILYECLAGRPPFPGSSVLEIVTRVSDGAFEPLAAIRRDTPPWLAEVVARALVKDPAERLPDGAALVRALDEGSIALAKRPAPRAVPALAVAGLGALCVSAGALVVVLRRGPPATTSVPAPVVAPRSAELPAPVTAAAIDESLRKADALLARKDAPGALAELDRCLA